MALVACEIVLCVIAAAITLNTLGNLRAYRRLASFAAPTAGAPFVSMLIPARNEERSLARCLTSLCAQEYGAYEIIVLDDDSTDRTGEIARDAARSADALRLIRGAPLPPGWLGNPWACAQLARAARGDLLLFTDADTVHAPTMVAAVVGAVADGADMVTAFPAQEIGSWSEALLVPFMLFTVWALLPVGRVWSDRSPRFVAANGQLLAFTRAAYGAVGGYGAVRDAVLDDVGLARRAKRRGLRVRLADGVGTVTTRMYHDAGETWRGFSKNAYGLVGQRVGSALAFAALMLALYVAPVVLLIAGFATHMGGWAWRWLPATLVMLMLVQRTVVAVRGRMPPWQVILHPLSVLFFVVILGNAMRWHRRGYGEWKGRRFAIPCGRDAWRE
jgi:chlorobactene glucosyltransferase